MTEALTVFLAGYVSVFMAGFQSRNVNTLNYKWAAVSSAIISMSSLYLWKLVPEMGVVGGIVYGIAGALGITNSMYIHERFIKRGGRKS